MEFNAVLNMRKSVRSFTGEPVSEEMLKKLLHAANAAPVGLAKYESVHLTVIQSQALLSEIEQNTARAFHASDRSFLYHAPQLILVSTAATDNVGYSNAAIIVQNMALAAAAEGVGACHIWGCVMALAANPELVAKLGLPEGFSPACALAVGQTDYVYTEREIPENRIGLNII